MQDLFGTPNQVTEATEVRTKLVPHLTAVLSSPHEPELTPDEVLAVLNKARHTAENEHRAAVFCILRYIPNIEVGTESAPARLTDKVLEWAGRKKKPGYGNKVPRQTIGPAANGRVIKKSGGL